MNILLMESSPEEQVVVKQAVERTDAGAIFYGPTSCQDALAHLAGRKDTRPEYVFLDLALPTIDGFGCLKMVKNSLYLAGMPVVKYSAQDQSVETSSIVKRSAYLSLSKSRSFLSLCNELKNIVVMNWRRDSEVLATGC